MTPNELAVLLNELLSSINATLLVENQVFIKRIWTRSKQLGSINEDYEGEKLTKYAMKLWDTTIDMSFYVNMDDLEALEAMAMLKDICFLLVRQNKKWQGENEVDYLNMMTSVFKLWLDCQKPENIDSSLLAEMKKYNDFLIDHKVETSKIRLIVRCYMYLSEYSSRTENWSYSKAYFDKAINLVSSLKNNDRKGEITYLYHVVVETGISIAKNVSFKSSDILYLVINSLEKVLKCEGSVQFPDYLCSYFLDLTIFTCKKDTYTLKHYDAHQLLQVFNKLLGGRRKQDIEYYVAVICMVLKSNLSTQEAVSKIIYDEYFDLVENVVILDDQDLSLLFEVIQTVNQKGNVSIQNIMDGIDLLVHRHENELKNAINSSTLYVFKIYCFSELVLEGHKVSIELDDAVLRSTLDGIYLIKESLDEVDLAAIQMILWRTGDVFYNECKYELAQSWYRYTNSITRCNPQGQANAVILAKKLSYCYMENKEYKEAYACLEKALEDSPNTVDSEDYLLLFKHALKTNYASDETTIPSIVKKMTESAGFQMELFGTILGFCHEYAKNEAIIKRILEDILACFDSKRYQEDYSLEHAKTFICLLIYALKCVIHIKKVTSDDDQSPKNLDFKYIASYMENVCDILVKLEVKDIDNEAIENDLEWMLQTAWNLGLYCFSLGENEEGASLFKIINKLSQYFEDMLFASTLEQNRIFKFIVISAYMMTQYNHEDKESEFKIENEDILTMFSMLKNPDVFDSITAIVSVFEIEIYSSLQQFDRALELFKAHEGLKECSFAILERMAGIVLLNPQCPLEGSFLLLKSLQAASSFMQANINDYAKWTSILISIAVKRNVSADLYECFRVFLYHSRYKKTEYPQNELYYLVVVAWNEGITFCFKSDFTTGERWCEAAFELLKYLRDERKTQLEEQMNQAYSLFQDNTGSDLS